MILYLLNENRNISNTKRSGTCVIIKYTLKWYCVVLCIHVSSKSIGCISQYDHRLIVIPSTYNLYTLKEFIDYYKCRGTTVYVTFLDASKALDRLNYWLLFDKLIKKTCSTIYY